MPDIGLPMHASSSSTDQFKCQLNSHFDNNCLLHCIVDNVKTYAIVQTITQIVGNIFIFTIFLFDLSEEKNMCIKSYHFISYFSIFHWNVTELMDAFLASNRYWVSLIARLFLFIVIQTCLQTYRLYKSLFQKYNQLIPCLTCTNLDWMTSSLTWEKRSETYL